MKEKIQHINSSSKAIDILKDSDFLRLFRYFILNYWKDYKKTDKNINSLILDFEKDNFLEIFKTKNESNLFKQFYKFFSDDLNKVVFLDTIREFDLDLQKLNIFLNIWEYLESIWKKQEQYWKEFYSACDKYKKNITDVLEINQINNISSLLIQNWYSNISPFNLVIKDCDFENKITYETLNWKIDFIWCVDEEKNIFYQNIAWKILKDWEWKIITHIDVNSIKRFWDYRIFCFTNEDWEGKIQIDPEINFWINSENNIDWNSFNVKEISYKEDTIDENEDIIEVEEKMQYLLINDDNWRRLLNYELDEISILDLLRFLHRNNPITINAIEKTLSRLNEISVENIVQIYNVNGIKFIELESFIKSVNYNVDEIEEEIDHFVMLDNWKVLTDNTEYWEVYIYSLWKIQNFLDNEFISFSLTQEKKINWYIDSFWKVVKIWEYRLYSLEKLPFTKSWENYYKLNWKDNLIFSEQYLLKEFSKYDSFNEKTTQFKIVMEWWEKIEINQRRYDEVIWILNDFWDVKFYLKYWEYKEKIEYNKLLKWLQKTESWKEALKLLNQTLNMIWI